MTGEGEPTVLVVTDSSDALAVAGALRADYDIGTAETGADALAAASDIGPVDALVVAAYLPDRSGVSLLEALRERSVGARAAVLADPGTPEFEGFDLQVATPPTAEDLRPVVDRLVSLGAYDDRVDRLYELAKRQGRRETGAAPVGDGGFEGVDEYLLDAREAADSALTDVREDDRERLFVDDGVPNVFKEGRR